MHISLPRAIVVCLALSFALPAQKVGGSAESERKATEVYISNDASELLAGVCISYTQPRWRQSYEDFLATMQGRYTRLGDGFWTTLDTIGAISVGGVSIPAGSYYLGLRIAADGVVSLLFFDSRQAMQARLLPGSTPLFTGEAAPQLVAPMTFVRNAQKEEVGKLAIELSADPKDPAKGNLVLRWGRHELRGSVLFDLAMSTPAAGGKK
jgi:hypothetical protein